jgi:alkylated DNA repair dioxygenase AlkB
VEKQMNLFEQKYTENLLPFDGTVQYFGRIISPEEANKLCENLFAHIAWKNDEAVIFGKHFITARKVAWYADGDYRYTYSNKTRQALAWTEELLRLKEKIEKISGETFNACLLNLYHSGEEGMGWHSDDEKTLAKNSAIASLSLGAERKFAFRHKQTRQTLSLILENGSLLIMKGTTQTHWHHSLPKTKKVKTPRINLTFRTMAV